MALSCHDKTLQMAMQKPLTMLRMSGQMHDNGALASSPIDFVSAAGFVTILKF